MTTEPVLEIGGLHIRVLERTSEDWLVVEAVCEASNARVQVNGEILQFVDVLGLRSGCEELYRRGTGTGTLDSWEPNLSIVFSVNSGRVSIEINITPDITRQKHQFLFELGKADLLNIIQACRAIEHRFK